MNKLEKSLELLDKFLTENDKDAIEKIINKVEENTTFDVPMSEYFEIINTQLNPDIFLNFDNVDWDYTCIVEPINKSKIKTDAIVAFSKTNQSIDYPMAA
jgi:uncharacterized protein YpuA (DUF1002 family)